MDDIFLKNAAELFISLELSELQIRDGTKEIFMKKKPVESAASAVSLKSNTVQKKSYGEENADFTDSSSDFHEIKAPLLGIFHLTPAPGKEPYVKIGDSVKAGNTLCIIEAMKTMNEIKATADGVVADICAEAGNTVEFGQTLFKLTVR